MESNTKICSKCNVSKPIDNFNKHKRCKYGVRPDCKECQSIRTILYNKSKIGLVTKIYHQQKRSSKKRNHPEPNYNLDDLKKWVFNQPNFELLYNSWVDSDYNKLLTPSCDRDTDDLGYCLIRLTLMTWGENKQKSHNDMRSGKLKNGTNPQKRVIGVNIKTGNIIEFHSTREAERNGFNHGNISACCNNKRKTHNGHTWKYSKSVSDKKLIEIFNYYA